MMLQNPIRRVAMLFLAASQTLLLLPGTVLAHAELETATPADKTTVTAPVTEVSGLYTEAMTPTGSSLVVKDATGAVVARGTVDPANTKRMVATPASPLGNGAYRVESTAAATDGHIEHATWTFTVAVAPTPSPTPVATSVPSAAVTAPPTPAPATPNPSLAPTPVPSADGSTTGRGGDVLLPIILALIILGAGAAYLLTRRNRPPSTT
jgi:copper resistance protein C